MSALSWNTVAADAADGTLFVAFAFDPPLLLGTGAAVLVFRNGIKQNWDTYGATVAADGVTLALPAGQEREEWETFEAVYPVGTVAGAGPLTWHDVVAFVSLPLFEPTESQASRALSAALGWARGHVTEDGLTADETALWEVAVLSFAWSILTRGSQPVLSLDTSETKTSWGAIGGLNPSEEFLATANMLLAQVGRWAGILYHPPVSPALQDAMDVAAGEAADVPISLRRW